METLNLNLNSLQMIPDGYVVDLPSIDVADSAFGYAGMAYAGKSIIGYRTMLALSFEEAVVLAAVVIPKGDVDRVVVIGTESGDVTFRSFDGAWFDNAGVPLGRLDGEDVDVAFNKVAGYVD